MIIEDNKEFLDIAQSIGLEFGDDLDEKVEMVNNLQTYRNENISVVQIDSDEEFFTFMEQLGFRSQ
jgi:hypothetical protein